MIPPHLLEALRPQYGPDGHHGPHIRPGDPGRHTDTIQVVRASQRRSRRAAVMRRVPPLAAARALFAPEFLEDTHA